MSDDAALQLGDLVWAKMKGFSPWPGRIDEPPPELKRQPKKTGPVQCIFFFGSNNYAWIEEHNIKPYLKYKAKLITSSKSASFKEAVDAIESFIADPSNEAAVALSSRDVDAEFNKLRESLSPVSASESRPKNGPPKEGSEKIGASPVPEKSAKKGKQRDSKRASADATPQPAAKRSKKSGSAAGTPKTPVTDISVDFTPRRNLSVSHLLNRPATVQRPTTPTLDIKHVSDALKMKKITPSKLSFGFLGLGIMGCGIVKNLINTGHTVVLWNRTSSKCRKFQDVGAEVRQTPADVIDAADITFSCVSDPQAAKDMVFGNCGVLQASSLTGKGYVEMTGIDAETSQDISEAITNRMGRYLEAQIQGSKAQAEEGTLIVLAAGDRSVFEDCQTCFQAIGRNSFYLGDVGNATKMNLVLQMMSGVTVAALAESMALADRAGLQQKDVLEILGLTNIASPNLLEKGNAIIKGDFPTSISLAHAQKDLKLALSMAEQLEQPLQLAATANEVYKHAKRLGYAEHDVSAVYVRTRF